MRTKCAISDAFVRDCVFAYCASVAQYVYSLSVEHFLNFTHVDSCIYRFPDENKFHQFCERIFFRPDLTAAKLCLYDVDGFDFHIWDTTFHCLSNDGTPLDL